MLAESSGRTRPTVLIVDDHRGMLERVSTLLRQDFEILCCLGDGSAALHAAKTLSPAVIVMDIVMPILDGFRSALEMRKTGVTSKITFMPVNEDFDFVAKAFESGGNGYVSKPHLNSDLRSAIEAAMAGRTFCSRMTRD